MILGHSTLIEEGVTSSFWGNLNVVIKPASLYLNSDVVNITPQISPLLVVFGDICGIVFTVKGSHSFYLATRGSFTVTKSYRSKNSDDACQTTSIVRPKTDKGWPMPAKVQKPCQHDQ